MIKLKTCPFCGGKPYLEESSRGFANGNSTHVCFVRCKECNARSPRVDLAEFNCSSSSAEAIALVTEAWNSRVSNIEEIDILTKRDRHALKKKAVG